MKNPILVVILAFLVGMVVGWFSSGLTITHKVEFESPLKKDGEKNWKFPWQKRTS